MAAQLRQAAAAAAHLRQAAAAAAHLRQAAAAAAHLRQAAAAAAQLRQVELQTAVHLRHARRRARSRGRARNCLRARSRAGLGGRAGCRRGTGRGAGAGAHFFMWHADASLVNTSTPSSPTRAVIATIRLMGVSPSGDIRETPKLDRLRRLFLIRRMGVSSATNISILPRLFNKFFSPSGRLGRFGGAGAGIKVSGWFLRSQSGVEKLRVLLIGTVFRKGGSAERRWILLSCLSAGRIAGRGSAQEARSVRGLGTGRPRGVRSI